jgi:transcriptional regulator with XRE-family HTH domain
MSEIALILKRLRDRGLRQCDVARQVGMSQSKLSRWENGRAPAGAEAAIKLLRLDEAGEVQRATGTSYAG